MSPPPDAEPEPANGVPPEAALDRAQPPDTNGADDVAADQVAELLRDTAVEDGPAENVGFSTSAFARFKTATQLTDKEIQDALPTPTEKPVPAAPESSVGSSTPDDTPSLQGSVASSSLGSAFAGSRFSPSPSLRPFDRRFQSRLQPGAGSPLQSPSSRPMSPMLGLHSRNSSLNRFDSGVVGIEQLDEERPAPWEVVRWTKLKKISQQLFTEGGRRNFGNPTCVVVSATIAVGTDKGLTLIFDYSQTLKQIIGQGTKAVECGSVTALAVSADHTTIASGHSNGNIFTWEIAKPAKPFLQIPALGPHEMENRKKDGHVQGASVLHLGFLGTRHTALVSADVRGMGFSHLATRGLGAVGRTVKTTRILGRYPMDVTPAGRSKKPSSVLAAAILPLGNSPEKTDTMGLVAMLTPYLLVVVSTTPIAQTQFKTVRPKEVASETAVTGCLAWYPAVKLKSAPGKSQATSKARLAYVWGNVLTLLELSVVGKEEDDKPPALEFKPKSRFKCDEAIVAVQWINRQVLGVLTLSQRLIILEDTSLRITETFDLMPKRILHRDVFSAQLRQLVERMDEEGSHHTQVADAYYNSFKAFKGRIFLLCSNDISVGALSNWADRLLAMMEIGDYIGAIALATSYYIGDTNKLTIGLPEDPSLRHPMVEEKLEEMMKASLRYAFGKNQSSSQTGVLEKDQLQELATACFDACLAMDRTDFLFDHAFEFFEQAEKQGIFLETLEPHILERRIPFIPPTVVKALINHYTSLEQESRLEEMICHMDTRTLDIDQVTSLCKKHQLYDAMIYVWNRALNDYITPTIDLLKLLLPLLQNGVTENGESMNAVNALKIFPYLAYTLTGRVYPTGEDIPAADADAAKAQLYYFLFLGQTIRWPKHHGAPFLTTGDASSEPSFPYLRLILRFDAASFLSALNEAFEDPFLNGTHEDTDVELGEDQVFGRSVNRQYIVSILLEVMNPDEFPPQDTIYLDMFIARNLPKYPQFILLSGSMLHRVLVGLCNPPGADIADDCQLSVEYLLTVYRPPDIDSLIEHFTRAGFFRVLKSIFRTERQYAKLLRIHFQDEDTLEAVFECIAECLRPRSGLNDRQKQEVKAVLREHGRKLIEIDQIRAARVVNSYAPDLHKDMLDTIDELPESQFVYLRTILEPATDNGRPDMKRHPLMENTDFVERYVRLMCTYDPEHVSDFVSILQSGDLRLESVIPAMESSGVMDAAVVLMAREGQIRQAMDRLLAHLQTLENALVGVIQASTAVEDSARSNDAAKETMLSLQKYARVGVWLCQGHMKTPKAVQANIKRRPENGPLTQDEMLWLNLVDTVVRIAKRCLTEAQAAERAVDKAMVSLHLRKFVQDTFSSLLAATSSSKTTSFLHILRAFLTRASESSPSLSDLRNVLGDIFEAYMYEEQLLSLANKLLDKDLFIHVADHYRLRSRGWRPAAQGCELCNVRLWGPGAQGGIYAAWERRRKRELAKLAKASSSSTETSPGGQLSAVARGKARSRDGLYSSPQMQSGEWGDGEGDAAAAPAENGGEEKLVLFRCRHMYHARCLEARMEAEGRTGEGVNCVVCARARGAG